MKLLFSIQDKTDATSLCLALDSAVCEQQCTFESLQGVGTVPVSLKFVNREADSLTPPKTPFSSPGSPLGQAGPFLQQQICCPYWTPLMPTKKERQEQDYIGGKGEQTSLLPFPTKHFHRNKQI